MIVLYTSVHWLVVYGLFFFYRFWAISDPVKMGEEASSVQKHQRKEVHPIVNCDKASLEYKVVISYITCKKSYDIVYIIVQAGDILSQVSQTHDVIM